MNLCKLQLILAGLALLAQPVVAQNVKLAKIALGMNETEVKAALASITPRYVDQPSPHTDM